MIMEKQKLNSLELAWLIRRHGIEMTHLSKGSHIASILSVADIIGVLYADIINVFPDNPKSPDRDYFILSKGHAGAAVYVALAERGFFNRQILKTHYQNGSVLSGHVSHKNVPGVDASTGSLGHGLSYAVGIALALQKQGRNNKVYVVIGDGECDEGSVWEAAMSAVNFKLSNLVAIVDANGMQSDGRSCDIMKNDLAAIWQGFGWDVRVVADGHDVGQIYNALVSPARPDTPVVLISKTIKGKGISFMENNADWHHSRLSDAQYKSALAELGGKTE